MIYSKFRNINGIILIDKPYGFSSNNVLQKVKGILKIKKIGHAGSLDPLATGMLPICCGKATKFSQFLINADKRYHVIAKLGQRTSTSDSEGEIIEIKPITDSIRYRLKTVLKHFRGKINQVPSMYSAIKYRGKALYKYARKGISIFRKKRKIIIYALKCLGFQNTFLELDIVCSKGTYIRTLVEDLGKKLNCGAHVASLRRLQIGNYSFSKMISVKKLCELEKDNVSSVEKFLISIHDSVAYFPEINILSNFSKNLKNGQKIKINNNLKNQFVRITEGVNKNFIGIGRINDNCELLPYRLII